MTEENFCYEEDNKRCCPLGAIPAAVWTKLLRPPFRRRHPILFWLAIIVAIAVLIWLIVNFLADDDAPDRDSIALVQIRGMILDVSPTLEWIRKIEKTPFVKGILLRVDSPGGGAAASQEVYAALARVAKKKPIAVSMGSTAASGGYMVSMAGERIFANGSTITGSIGVRMDIPQIQGLLEKIGVGQETLVTAPYKDAASYTHPLTPRDRAYLESVIENMHEQFVEIVAAGRKMPMENAREMASGKIFTGREALKLGLIDEIGGYDDALNWLCQRTGVSPDRKLYKKPERSARLIERALGAFNLPGNGKEIENLRETLTQPVFLY
ncbi:MAG: signal peptide peptidase SppA [Desulfovibrio sp.]|nr:signal peptide peptidase SppA [Desulfovibrio sp.]